MPDACAQTRARASVTQEMQAARLVALPHAGLHSLSILGLLHAKLVARERKDFEAPPTVLILQEVQRADERPRRRSKYFAWL